MANFELVSYPNAMALAQAVANDWLRETAQSKRAGTSHFVALSGGRIARRLYAAVAEMTKTRDVSFAHVHFFWADERCVPPADAESNFALADEHLFQPLELAPGAVHRIPGELIPTQAAAFAAAELSRVVPCGPAGQPVLDLVFLGMGEDGHVASLFPDEPEDAKADKSVYRAVTASKPPPRRVTLGYGPIAAARQVWVLVSGAGKEQALRESLANVGRTPLAEVLKMRLHTKIFTDIAPSNELLYAFPTTNLGV